MPKRTAAAGPGEAAETAAGIPAVLDRPKKHLRPQVFFPTIAAYPKSELTCSYVYRRWPIIDLKLINPELKFVYVDKVEGPVSEAYLLRRWGSGEYRLTFNDEGQPRGRAEICETVFAVNDPELLPVIEDLRTLVLEHPMNRSFVKGLRARGLLAPEGQELKAHGLDSAAAELSSLAGEIVRGQFNRGHDPVAAVGSKALDLMAEASRSAIKIAVDQVAKPSDPIDLVLKLKELSKADDSVLKLLLDSQSKQNQMLLDLMKNGQQQQPDLAAEVTKFERLAGVFERFGGGRGKSGGGGWEMLLQMLPMVLNPLARLADAWAAGRGIASAPRPAPTPRSAVVTAASSLPAAERVNPMPIEIPQEIIEKFGAAAVNAIGRGTDGADFADSVCNVLGEAIYDRVAQLGETGIFEALQSVPALWAQLAPLESDLRQFVREFVAYGQPDASPAPEAPPKEA